MNRVRMLTVVTALALLGTGSAGAGPVRSEGDTHLNKGQTAPLRQHQYPDVSVDPFDADHVIVVDSDGAAPTPHCSVYVTINGGASWTYTALDLPEDLPEAERGCVWPSVAIGRTGRAYVAYATNSQPSTGTRLYVARSDDGGLSFGEPVRADGGIRAWSNQVAVDNTGGPRDGTVYLGWFQLATTSQGRNVWVASSTDAGETFTAPVRVNDVTRPIATRATMALAPNGDVYVLYLDSTPFLASILPEALFGVVPPVRAGYFTVMFDRSSDGGKTWGTDVIVDPFVTATVVAENQVVIPMPEMAVGTDGTIYAVWSDRRNGDWDVFMRMSADAGTTWSSVVRVNQDPLGNGVEQLMPSVSVAPDGRVDVAFLDRRRDAENRYNETVLAHSHDRGATFLETFVSTVASDAMVGGSGGIADHSYKGDMVGVGSTLRRSFVVWPDARNGTHNDGVNDLYGSVIEH